MSTANDLNPDGGAIEVIDVGAGELARMQDAAALDVQVATAKQYPRSVKTFQSDLESWATFDEEVAGECFYAVPRDGKTMVGPSIRFAELVAAAYTNLVTESRVLEVGSTTVRVQATCRDLERNVAIRVEAERRIVNKYGQRFSLDMIQTTSNAAISLALRNAIMRVVPKALWLPVWQKARKIAVGDGKPFSERRDAAVQWLAKVGVTEERILEKTGKASIKDLDADDVLFFRSVAGQIQNGELTPEQVFPEPGPEPDDTAAAANAALSSEPVDPAASDEPGPEVDPETGEVIPSQQELDAQGAS